MLFWKRSAGLIRDTVDETVFEQTVERLREAIDARINTHDIPVVVNHAGNEFGITDSEQHGVLQHLLEQEDMTLFGLANAVTRQSHDSESYERATGLEEISYRMLTMPRRQWERINENCQRNADDQIRRMNYDIQYRKYVNGNQELYSARNGRELFQQ